MYEAKYIYHYNHRYCSWNGSEVLIQRMFKLSDPDYLMQTRII